MLTLGILSALASSAIWGAGDFLGGIATRGLHQLYVVALSAISGIALLLVCVLIVREPLPQAADVAWAAAAGASGGFGIGMLYRGLSLANAAIVAPTAAVVGALLPLIVGIARAGMPGATRLGGFACALTGIWLVAKSTTATDAAYQALRIAVLAGLGLGGFLALIAFVPAQLVFGPLIVSRFVSLLGALVMLRFAGSPKLPAVTLPIALGLLTGVLDAGGNIFYIIARQFTRLDVAAVLSSLYPMSTVLLSRIFLKERVTTPQAVGVALCLAAVALIAI
jgi:drug/metabolite transporter (DMT)-like permease